MNLTRTLESWYNLPGATITAEWSGGALGAGGFPGMNMLPKEIKTPDALGERWVTWVLRI